MTGLLLEKRQLVKIREVYCGGDIFVMVGNRMCPAIEKTSRKCYCGIEIFYNNDSGYTLFQGLENIRHAWEKG
jgi:hypothetical protein